MTITDINKPCAIVTRPTRVGHWNEAALRVLRERYLLRNEAGEVVETPEDMCWRVAVAIAQAEARYASAAGHNEKAVVQTWAERFYDLMIEQKFLPNSPTMMNAGKGNNLQYSACYVLPVGDSMVEIFDAIKNAALIHQSGGGTGFAFSRLRPAGSLVHSSGGKASGPVSFLRVFNAATEAVKQGGCLAPETRVATGIGLIPLSALGPDDLSDGAWYRYPMPLPLRTDNGLQAADEFYRHGITTTIRIKTAAGYALEGTSQHRIRVITPEGEYAWRRLDELRIGDWVALQMDTHPDLREAKLPEFVYAPHPNTARITIPERPTRELGIWLGFLIGDGAMSRSKRGTGRVILTIADDEPELREEILRLGQALFGLTPTPQRKKDDGSTNFFYASTMLYAWLQHIGVDKKSSSTAQVPVIVFRASREFAYGFLQGLFSADGTVNQGGYPSLYSTSLRLVEDVQQLLLSLGIPSEISRGEPRSDRLGQQPVYRLRIVTRRGIQRFAECIGFIQPDKQARVRTDGWEYEHNDVIPYAAAWMREIYSGPGAGTGPGRTPRGANRSLQRDLMHYFPESRAPRQLTYSRLQALAEKHEAVRSHPKVQWFLHNRQFYSQVAEITTGESLTLDLSVPGSHTYIANGFVSHNTRRGANMGILRVDHPDIEEFITCKLDGSITNFNISVAATDAFMKAVMEDTEYDILAQPGWPDGRGGRYQGGEVIGRKRAREIFQKIVEAAWRTGDPGLVFIDRVNASPANPTPALGQIEATNPCVTGDTWVLTTDGPRQVAELVGRPCQLVVNGQAWSTGSEGFFSTGRKPVLRLRTREGHSLRLTANHLVARVVRCTGSTLTTEWVEAERLRPGDQVILHNHRNLEGWNGVHTEQEGYLIGLLLGDGSLEKEAAVLSTWGVRPRAEAVLVEAGPRVRASSHRADLEGRFPVAGRDEWRMKSAGLRDLAFSLGMDIGNKALTPAIERAGSDFYRGFLRGLFDAGGSVQGDPGKGISVRLSRSDRDLLEGVQRMLLRLGINSRIDLRHEAGRGLLPNGREDMRFYPACEPYDLVITGDNVAVFAERVGFTIPEKQATLNRLLSSCQRALDHERFVAEVVTIEPDGEEEVFDVRVPFTNAFDANGFLVHNCGEQPLLPNEACNLGSVNLFKFVKPATEVDPGARWHPPQRHPRIDWEELERVVRTSVRFLDDVIEVNPYPLPEINESVKGNRRIGLGVMGWADMLFALGIPYDSEEALELAHQVMGFINEVGHDVSAQLAEERGPFPNWPRSIYANDRPLRNATVTTIAPTGTISIIAGASSGIEPIFALAFSHIVGDRHLVFINPVFEQVARARGFYSEELMRKVAETGTLHGIEGIPDDVRRVFVTAHEIAPEWHVRMQGAFQKYTDNGVSKCVTGDTLIFTERGIIPIASLHQKEPPDSFRSIRLTVADNPAPVVADLFYYGGEQPVVGVETDLGITLRATPNHRVRVIRDGEIVWRRMDELNEGDYMVVSYGYGVFGHCYEFSQVYGAPYRPAERTNAKPIRWPYKITTDLARALGYLVADGGFNQNSVLFTQVDSEVLADYCQIMEKRLELTPHVITDKRREETKSAVIHSRDLATFFSEYLGCGQNAESKRTPACILQSGPEIQKEFIRGLTLDGYIGTDNGRLVVVGTVSRHLAVEVQAMLLNLSIPARLEAQPIYYDYLHEENRKEYIYNVVIVPAFRRSFVERIGYAEARKQEAAWAIVHAAESKTQPGTSYVIPGVRPLAVRLAQQKQACAISRKLKDYLRSFINAEAEITHDTLLYLLDICRDLESTPEWQKLNTVATRQVLYTPVTRIWWDRDFVYDLQVPETHSFITNGFISHNTVNLPNNATVEDVAKAFLLAYEVGCLGITVFRDGCKGVQVLHVGTKLMGKGAVEDERQAKGAEEQGSGGAEEPSETRGQGEGEKGRRKEVTLSPPLPVTSSPLLPTSDGYYQKKPRPAVLHGSTYRQITPLGTAYITINTNGENQPFEVFLNVGKAGSDVAAVSEALGRLISLILRLPSSLSPRERLEEVVEQLAGIGGGRQLGFGPNRVRSLPDAVAQVLAEHLSEAPPTPEPNVAQLSLPLARSRGGDLCPECGQATFVFEEGCKKCASCGFSEC